MTDWAVRALSSADAPVAAALHADGFDEPWTLETLARLMVMPGAFGFLAARGADPGGFVLARAAADEAEIITLAVSASRRRQGLGRRLVTRAMDEARRLGARRMFLEVAADNAPGQALYRALGFSQVGRRAAYYGRPGGAPRDALVMAAPL